MEDKQKTEPLDIITILSLPKHLRKTALAIVKLGEGSAAAVASETKREFNIENSNLNELFKMEFVGKKKRGFKSIYYT
jgi:hypothetical protein